MTLRISDTTMSFLPTESLFKKKSSVSFDIIPESIIQKIGGELHVEDRGNFTIVSKGINVLLETNSAWKITAASLKIKVIFEGKNFKSDLLTQVKKENALFEMLYPDVTDQTSKIKNEFHKFYVHKISFEKYSDVFHFPKPFFSTGEIEFNLIEKTFQLAKSKDDNFWREGFFYNVYGRSPLNFCRALISHKQHNPLFLLIIMFWRIEYYELQLYNTLWKNASQLEDPIKFYQMLKTFGLNQKNLMQELKENFFIMGSTTEIGVELLNWVFTKLHDLRINDAYYHAVWNLPKFIPFIDQVFNDFPLYQYDRKDHCAYELADIVRIKMKKNNYFLKLFMEEFKD